MLNNTLINNLPTTKPWLTIQQPIINKSAYNNALVQNTVQQITTSVNSNQITEVRPNSVIVIAPPPPIISTAIPCINPCQKTITVVMPEPEIFDLALTKKLMWSQTIFSPWDIVTFEIEIYNQWTESIQGVKIVDYIPTWLELRDPNWSTPSSNWKTWRSYESVLAPGEVWKVTIMFKIKPNVSGTIVNRAEIWADNWDDIDSTTDDIQNNDCYGWDNVILWNGTGSPTCTTSTDQDDHDPAQITVQIPIPPVYDLRINKSVLSPWPYTPWQNVQYTVTVYNTGNITVSWLVTDNLPVGLSYTGWTTYSFTQPQWWATITALWWWQRQVNNIAPGQYITMQYTVIIWANASGSLINNVGIKPIVWSPSELVPDVAWACIIGKNPLLSDSISNINNAVSGTNNRDCEKIQVQPIPKYDLRIKKDVSAWPYLPGQTITYTLSVLNTGNIVASWIVTDMLPAWLQYTWVATYSPAGYIAQTGTGTWQVSNLEPWKRVTITYKVIIWANTIWKKNNNVKIVPNSGLPNEEIPDKEGICEIGKDPLLSDSISNINNAVSGTNNRDCEEIEVQPAPSYDLRIKKDVSSWPYQPGQTVTYTLSVLNTGNIVASWIVTDMLPAWLQYTWVATYSPAWYIAQTGTGTWQVSNLEPWKRVTITYKVIIWANTIWKKKNNVKIVPNSGLPNEEIPDKEGICEIGKDPLVKW